MGSATPKYMRPMPMPAAKSMAIHEKKLYWGLELSGPRRMLPALPKASTSRKMKKSDTSMVYTQLNLRYTYDWTASRACSVRSGHRAHSSDRASRTSRPGMATVRVKVVFSFSMFISSIMG